MLFLPPKLAVLAGSQAATFNRGQAHAHELSNGQLARRVGAGALIAHPGDVYAIAGTAPTWDQRLWLAVLSFAVGKALVGRRAAAALRGFEGWPEGRVELLVPRTALRPRAFDVHATRSFPAKHDLIRGLPVTTAPRTIIDLTAGMVRRDRVEHLVDAQLARRLVSLPDLLAEFAELAARGRRGMAVLGAVLADRMDGYVPPASVLEATFVALLDAAGIEQPTRQSPLPSLTDDGRVDFWFAPQRHIVELDGRAWHDRRKTRAQDQWRDNEATALGCTIQRYGYADLVHERDRVLETLQLRLALGAPFR